MPVLAMTLPLSRRSAIHVPRRDLVAGAGDELVLRVSLVEADRPDAAPVDLRRAFARVRMHVFRDASPLGGNHDYAPDRSAAVVTTRSAMAVPARPFSVDLTVAAEETRCWAPGARLGWSLQGAAHGQETALCWGALHMRPGLGMPPLFVLTDEGARVLTDDERYVVM